MVSFLFKSAFVRLVGREDMGDRVQRRLTCAFCHFAFIHATGCGNEDWFVAVEGGV